MNLASYAVCKYIVRLQETTYTIGKSTYTNQRLGLFLRQGSLLFQDSSKSAMGAEERCFERLMIHVPVGGSDSSGCWPCPKSSRQRDTRWKRMSERMGSNGRWQDHGEPDK